MGISNFQQTSIKAYYQRADQKNRELAFIVTLFNSKNVHWQRIGLKGPKC